MKKSHRFWSIYLGIALLFAIYESFWGPESYKGFFFNLGKSLIWPVILIPGLGKVIGAILLLIIIVAILIFR